MQFGRLVGQRFQVRHCATRQSSTRTAFINQKFLEIQKTTDWKCVVFAANKSICDSRPGRKNNLTETGDPLENAVAERIHRTIKEEFTTDREINFSSIAEAKKKHQKVH